MREAFGIPDDHDPVGVITIGHRDGRRAAVRLAAHPEAPRPRRARAPRPLGTTRVPRMTVGGTEELPRAVAKLQALVRIPTVSYREPERVDTAAFDAFVEELARQFPLLHERLELTRVHTHGLLFHWRGRERRAAGRADGAPRRRTGRGHLAARRVQRRRRRRPDLGPRHPRRQGLPGRRSARRSRPCSSATSPRPRTSGSRSAATRRCSVRRPSTAVAELEAPRRPAVVRRRRGRRDRPRRVHRRRQADRRRRRDREGRSCRSSCGSRAAAATPPPRRRMGPTARLARAITRLDRSPMPTSLPAPTVELFRRLAPHAPLAAAAADGERRPARPGARRALLTALGPETRRDGAHDVRGHHALRAARRST